MRCVLGVFLAATLASPAWAQPTLLRWSLSSNPDPAIVGSSVAACPAGKAWFLESVAAAGSDRKQRWRTPVPTWISARPVDCVFTVDIRSWHDPIERSYNYRNLYLGFLDLGSVLAFSTRGGVFALDARTGRRRFEWRPRETRADFYVFDQGTFEVFEKGTSLCKGPAPSAIVFAACANKLFYFDERVAAVLDATTGATLFETPFDNRFRDSGALATRDGAHIVLGPYTLALAGMSFMQ